MRDLPLSGLELVEITGGAFPPERAAAMAREPSVGYAEPNFIWSPAAVVPDDAEFPSLWGLDNTGQTGGTADADIDAPEAWEVTSGSEDVIVGVIDTGVKIDHPDLAANVWVNADEIAGNGIDGDDHGTHVSGTIAGVWNNAANVAGVSQGQIMALKFLGPEGGTTSGAILALDYAIDNGADLTSNSWGGGGASSALQDKIAEAGDAGQLFVAAAGNDGADTDSQPHYPSSYPNDNIVSVAATDHNDGLASFSNFGDDSVDLGAPGVSILSTVPRFGKGILVGPDTPAAENYRAAYHSFGLEGVLDPADRQALLGTTLPWAGVSAAEPILLVDDDEGASFQTIYQDALTALGYTNVTTFTVSTSRNPNNRHGPSASTMAGHRVVIWFTGADFDSTLTSTDQSNLTTYLDGGTVTGGMSDRNLALFGVDIGFDLTDDGSVTNSFLTDVLYTDYVADLDLNFRPSGISGTPYATVPTLELKSGTSGDGQTFSSALAPRTGAVAGLRGAPTTWFNGTSMATPHVSGAAAQVIAAYPGIGHLTVKDRLMNNGDAVASLAGKTVSGKRLNLAGALDTTGAPALTSVSATPNPFSPDGDGTDDTTTLSWTQNEPADVTITVTPDGGGTPVRTEVLGAHPQGSHTWVWDGAGSGSVVPDGSYELKVDATGALGNASTATTPVEISTDLGVFADFDGDGYADLAIGVPGEDLPAGADAGVVNVLYGSDAGLGSAGNQLWQQNSPFILETNEAGDGFGAALSN